MALIQKKISLSDIDIIGTYDGEKLIKAEVVPKNSIVIPPVVPPVVPPVTPPWSWPKPTAGIFAAPTGSAAGVGTVTNPMSLEKALSIGGSGQQIWLRGGTYNVAKEINPRLTGTQATPWKISAYSGEEPVVNVNTSRNHGLMFNQAVAWEEYRGIRFTDQSKDAQGGATYDLVKFDRGNNLSFLHCCFDNCKWSGILSNGPAANILLYGCVILNNGVNTQNGDHGIYLKSKAGTFTIENCFLINNAGHAVHAYNGSSSPTEGVSGVKVLENSIFTYGEPSDRFVIMQDSGGNHQAVNCDVIGNVCFNQWPAKSGDATDADRSSIKVVNGVNCKVENNFIWGGEVVASGSVTRLDNLVLKDSVWPKQQVWVRPSRFDAGIVHVTCFNPAMAELVPVDLTGKLPAGKFEIRAASSPQKIVSTGAYSGAGIVSLPMLGLTYDAQVRSGGYHWPGNGKACGFIVRRIP